MQYKSIIFFVIKTYVVVTSFAGYLPSTFSQCEGKYLYIDLTINTTRRAVLRNRKGGVGKSTYSMFWAFGRIELVWAKSSILGHNSDRQIKTRIKGSCRSVCLCVCTIRCRFFLGLSSALRPHD